MPQVNFYLKKPNPTTNECLIFLKFRYFNNSVVFSFKQTVLKSDWNAKKQRVKSTTALASDNKHYLNDLLDNLAGVCMSTYNKELANGIPATRIIKKALTDFLLFNTTEETKKNLIPDLFSLIDRFRAGEIKFKGRDRRPNTLKTYTTSKKSLLNFQKKENYPVNYETINLDFFYRYVAFLKKKGFSHNTISKRIKTVKVYMNEAVDLKFTKNLDYRNRKFSMPEREVEAIFLSQEEIMQLYRYDFSNNKRLEQVRDLFVFGCFVGLRYSDYSNIKPENITYMEGEPYLKVQTIKTDTLVIIPCNPIVLEIFKKYDHNPNKLPKAISDVKFNLYIKEACKECGLTQKGRLLSHPEKELWECVSSHTARRSMVTNLHAQGFPITEIMKITGHKKLDSFSRYIKITKEAAAKKLNQHFKDHLSLYALSKVS